MHRGTVLPILRDHRWLFGALNIHSTILFVVFACCRIFEAMSSDRVCLMYTRCTENMDIFHVYWEQRQQYFLKSDWVFLSQYYGSKNNEQTWITRLGIRWTNHKGTSKHTAVLSTTVCKINYFSRMQELMRWVLPLTFENWYLQSIQNLQQRRNLGVTGNTVNIKKDSSL